MLLITRAANDIEIVQCGDDCEYYAFRDECEDLGWVWDEANGQWRCEDCHAAYADMWGLRVYAA
ncbi:hypothetical protein [Streptomyces sp. NBC_01304]|uniref:hypothetical protein n=1 Tax=Streptomyces sp. NBC_01304 TaxID=2903818 RepID=UPI002E0EB4D9|nr:hypothetical protein OG430_44560 [Streptomyces sp. NBC_01304]